MLSSGQALASYRLCYRVLAAHATGRLDGNNNEMRPSFWCPFPLLVVMNPILDSEFTLGLGDISITLRKGWRTYLVGKGSVALEYKHLYLRLTGAVS